MCVVLVPNIGISTSISNTTQIRPQHFRRSCVSTGNVRGASAKYWYQYNHIQHYTNTPTALQKGHVCPLELCVVLVPNIGISTSISNTTQIRPQHFRMVLFVHWEFAWCQCQILVLAPAYPTLHKYAHCTSERSCVSTGNVRGASAKYCYQHQHIQHYTNKPTVVKKLHVCPLGICVVLLPNICLAPAYPKLHKYAHSTSETSCESTGNVRGASAKYWFQHQHIQHYRNTPTELQKLHVCPLGMCVVLVPIIGISTSISNTTQIRPQNFGNFMCVHWECAWCQCQILVLAPAYPTLHKYAHSTSERSCVSTGNVRGASAKYLYQHQHIQHYTNTPTVVKKLHVCPVGICAVLLPNICLAPAYPTLHKYVHSTSETSCESTRNVRGASAKYWYQHQHIQHYTNTPTALQKGHVCPLGMCVVLVPNIGISTSISNTTQIRPLQLRNFMCVQWEFAWCYCQIFVQQQHIQHYTNTSTALQKGHVCPLGMCVVLVPNIGISTSISNTTQIRPLQLRNFMCVHWEFAWCYCQIFVQNQHIQLYTNTSTALQKLHVSPLGMCVVLVPNIGISTSISNTTEIRPQNFRNFMCVHWECAWCQCQILILAPAYPALHKYAHSS